MTELENIGKLAATASELLDAIRGGEIANMKAEHVQVLQDFITAYNAKINEFTQQKGEALNQFNQEKAQAFAAADSQLQQRRAAVDAVLADLAGHTIHNVHYYDGVLHTKSSLALKADPADEVNSEWVQVPYPADRLGYLNYPSPNALTMIYLKKALSYHGGYPDYVTDKSRSTYQFVVANSSASSAQINQEIESKSLVIRNFGGWNDCALSGEIHTLQIGDLHAYKSLWVRAVNIGYKAGEVPQNIEQFGGNCAFAVDKVINYPRIAK